MKRFLFCETPISDMSTEIPLLDNERIKFKGIFDFEELYIHTHDWLEWRKYDIAERKYKEKITPTGKDVEIEWRATKDIDEYSQFKIEIMWRLINLTEVEVQQNGAKVTKNKATIKIAVSAALVLDWKDKWEETPIIKFLKTFYEKYLYHGTIDKLKGELWKQGWDFYNELKAFLNLYKYT